MRIYFRPHENYSASPEAMTARIAETERAHAPRVLYINMSVQRFEGRAYACSMRVKPSSENNYRMPWYTKRMIYTGEHGTFAS